MNKDELRLLLKQRLQNHALTVANAPLKFSQENQQLHQWEHILFAGTKTLFAYKAFQEELNIDSLISSALRQHIQVALPRVEGNNLSFCALDSSGASWTESLSLGSFGILEPRQDLHVLYAYKQACKDERILASSASLQIDYPLVILVPALAFTKTGERLGRGKGYYDRFLHDFLSTTTIPREKIKLIGVAYEFQIVKSIPTEAHDITMDSVLVVSKN